MVVRAFFGILVATAVLNASQADRAVFGKVCDGANPIPGAIVTITNESTVRSVTTDGNGRFAIEQASPGKYDLRISAQGYAVFESAMVVHSRGLHRNLIPVKGLIPADQQTISVAQLRAQMQPRSLKQSAFRHFPFLLR